jgi:TRAP-type C4-dicarboxylate transport system permease large subunit
LAGISAERSIYKMFLTGIVVSLIVNTATFLLVLIYIRGPILEKRSRDLQLGGIAGVLPWLFAPVFILGIFFMGIVTPSEMGIVAVGCFALLGIFQRSLTIKQVTRASVQTLRRAGSIFLIAVFGVAFIRLLAYFGVPLMIASPSLGPVGVGIFSALCCLLVGPIAAVVIIPAMGGGMAVGEAMILGIVIGSIIPPFGPIFASLGLTTRDQPNKLARETAAFEKKGLDEARP